MRFGFEKNPNRFFVSATLVQNRIRLIYPNLRKAALTKT